MKFGRVYGWGDQVNWRMLNSRPSKFSTAPLFLYVST